jgi:hypothetical protein
MIGRDPLPSRGGTARELTAVGAGDLGQDLEGSALALWRLGRGAAAVLPDHGTALASTTVTRSYLQVLKRWLGTALCRPTAGGRDDHHGAPSRSSSRQHRQCLG